MSLQDRIAKGLATQLEAHRIVFWHDVAHEFRAAFDALALKGVETIAIENNEFAVKYRVLRGQPSGKFLLYRGGPRPADADNWLLDLELAHAEFKTDQTAIRLTELRLPLDYGDVISAHAEFFKSERRFERLRGIEPPPESKAVLRLRMLAIAVDAEGGLDTVVEALLAQHVRGKDDGLRTIARAGLEPFLWEQMAHAFGYRSEAPGIADFAITLFRSCYRAALGEAASLAPDALLFFRRWKNSRAAEIAFEKLSADAADALAIVDDLAGRDVRTLIDLDHFERIDHVVIPALVAGLAAQTLPQDQVQDMVRRRLEGHWQANYHDVYQAISHAAGFQQAIAALKIDMTSLGDGITRYADDWFRVDRLYRKFILHMQASGQVTTLAPLYVQIENHYANSYLMRLNDAWQVHVDAAPRWAAEGVPSHRHFYRDHIAHFRQRDLKLCVIISDALRYEIADELVERIRQLDRYEAELTPMLGCLPSYTQLGMAALLPNTDLRIADNDSSMTIVDGQSAQGTENRRKILAGGRAGDRTTAIKADALMNMQRDEARTLFRDHDVVYVYHNEIDAVGDKQATEERVFEAVESTLDTLVQLVKKLAGANATNLIVTADHGFLYQHRAIEESDFSSAEVTGDNILFRGRRFVLGHGLKPAPGLRHFTAEQAGLQGDVEILIPKSVSRLRRQGSGSRFVHGGAALQEVVVPVVRINKKRQSDLAIVEVEAIPGANRRITSSQLAIRLYQSGPVTEKVQPRQLVVGLYGPEGTAISDEHVLVFDNRSDKPRDRERQVRLLLARDADAFEGREVILKLRERVGETTHFRDYQTVRYTLARSITNDFDF